MVSSRFLQRTVIPILVAMMLTAAPPAILRAHAKQARADELAALERLDDRQRPPGWRLSPWAAVEFVVGGRLSDGTEITPKYIGDRRLVEIAVATLATDRALLLLGVPGTASEGWIYLLFEATDPNGVVQGTMARFNLSWLLDGKSIDEQLAKGR